MKLCPKCGKEINEEVRFCPSCGAEIAASEQQTSNTQQPAGGTDAQDNKTMGILAYILFFVPLLTGAHKKSPFVKFHTNQGAILFIVWIGYSIISGIIRSVVKVTRVSYVLGIPYEYTATPVWLSTILSLVWIPIFILCIMGIMNAAKGVCKELPVIGNKFTIIK